MGLPQIIGVRRPLATPPHGSVQARPFNVSYAFPRPVSRTRSGSQQTLTERPRRREPHPSPVELRFLLGPHTQTLSEPPGPVKGCGPPNRRPNARRGHLPHSISTVAIRHSELRAGILGLPYDGVNNDTQCRLQLRAAPPHDRRRALAQRHVSLLGLSATYRGRDQQPSALQ